MFVCIQALNEIILNKKEDIEISEEEIKWCPECWNKIKRDYDDEYCCECWAKLD
jgi:hypothetical protein